MIFKIDVQRLVLTDLTLVALASGCYFMVLATEKAARASPKVVTQLPLPPPDEKAIEDALRKRAGTIDQAISLRDSQTRLRKLKKEEDGSGMADPRIIVREHFINPDERPLAEKLATDCGLVDYAAVHIAKRLESDLPLFGPEPSGP